MPETDRTVKTSRRYRRFSFVVAVLLLALQAIAVICPPTESDALQSKTPSINPPKDFSGLQPRRPLDSQTTTFTRLGLSGVRSFGGRVVIRFGRWTGMTRFRFGTFRLGSGFRRQRALLVLKRWRRFGVSIGYLTWRLRGTTSTSSVRRGSGRITSRLVVRLLTRAGSLVREGHLFGQAATTRRTTER